MADDEEPILVPPENAAREDILRGPLTSALVRLAWPTATTAMLHGLVAMVDLLMVGRLGSDAVAAVGSSRQVMMVLMVAAGAVAAGCGTLVAQAVGRGDRDEANHILTQGLLVFLATIGLVFIPLGWWLSPILVGALLGDSPGVVELAVPYLRVVILSGLFTMTGFAAQASLRGAGDTRTPLKLTFYDNVLNIGFNYVFIFGVPALGVPGLGVLGAAIGTACARGTTSTILLYWLASGRLLVRIEPPRRWRFDLAILIRTLRIGVPTSISSLVLNLYGVLVVGILARTDAAALAVTAYTMSMMLRNLGTWTTWGLSEATMAMVGQNVGARQLERADRLGHVAARVAGAFLVALGVLMAAVAPFALPVLLDEPDAAVKAQVIAIGILFLQTNVIGLPLLGMGMAYEGALRGAGDAVAPLIQNLIALLGIGIVSAALLALPVVHLGPVTVPGCGLGHLGVFIGIILAGWSRGVLAWWRWRRGVWRGIIV